MEIHKETTAISLALGGRNGKVECCGTLSSSLHSMGRFLERNRRPNVKLHFVYEADPTGFVVQRRLVAWNEDCIVVSPCHFPKRAGDRVKSFLLRNGYSYSGKTS